MKNFLYQKILYANLAQIVKLFNYFNQNFKCVDLKIKIHKKLKNKEMVIENQNEGFEIQKCYSGKYDLNNIRNGNNLETRVIDVKTELEDEDDDENDPNTEIK